MEKTPAEKDPYILIEFGETRKAIRRDKLPEARAMEAYMRDAAHRAGWSQEKIDYLLTLRIVKEED